MHMKQTILTLALLSFTLSATAQNDATTRKDTHVMRYQQCPWKNVAVVKAGDEAAAKTTVISTFNLPKTSTRQTFSDLNAGDLKKVQKAAKRAHSCLVTVDDDYHFPKQIKNQDPKKEAELNAQIHFYFMIPIETIDQACDLPPYKKRDRDKLAETKAAEQNH